EKHLHKNCTQGRFPGEFHWSCSVCALCCRYPNTACELLTSDVPQINDKLGGDETLLNILYDFLDHEPPLNPLLASFFSKTIGNLIARKTEQVIAFLRKKDKFISLVLKHIDTSAMMDLLLRLISCVEPAALRHDVLNWLNEAKIIQRLVELIHSSQDEDVSVTRLLALGVVGPAGSVQETPRSLWRCPGDLWRR
ncbi:serine/threonine-protein phosphatase 6 regulatory subunit 2-like, partial [Neopelma chrysocephalum]|uniref:serine/threonine-protein phosphatase 6 regulatory subunit 2-like n=1 Tax=Neopelma chrysocephalum TaxID=114329 RepID=UPI000FCCE81F